MITTPKIPNLESYLDNDGNVDLEYLFPDVDRLIRSTCYQFVQRYGGDAEECYAESCYWFIKTIVPLYNPDKGRSFSGWTRWVVYNHLLDKFRSNLDKLKGFTRVEQTDEQFEEHNAPDRFDCERFKRSLSRDAAIVIHMTTMSRTIERVLNSAGFGPRSSVRKRKSPNPIEVKVAVAKELRETWDWSYLRIHVAFKEIREGLS